jgi:hypothetical protein
MSHIKLYTYSLYARISCAATEISVIKPQFLNLRRETNRRANLVCSCIFMQILFMLQPVVKTVQLRLNLNWEQFFVEGNNFLFGKAVSSGMALRHCLPLCWWYLLIWMSRPDFTAFKQPQLETFFVKNVDVEEYGSPWEKWSIVQGHICN